MKKLISGIILVLAIALIAGCIPSLPLQQATVNDEVYLDAQPTVTIKSFNGSVTVQPLTGAESQEGQIYIMVEKKGSGSNIDLLKSFLDKIELKQEVDAVNKRVTFEAVQPALEQGISNVGVNLIVYVPVSNPYTVRVNNLTVVTSNDQVSVTGFDGTMNLTSSNGDINMSQIKHGDITVKTSNADIIGSEVDGDIKGVTTNGGITFENSTLLTTDLQASNDSIFVQTVIDPACKYELETTNGNLELAVPLDSKMYIDAVTSNGKITCSLPYQPTTEHDTEFVGTVGNVDNGGAIVNLTDANGNINISEWNY